MGVSACGGADQEQQASPAEAERKTGLAVNYASAVHLSSIYDSNDQIIGQVGQPTLSVRSSNTPFSFSQIAPPTFRSTTPNVQRPQTNLPCGAFWYQDFGLDYTRYLNSTMTYPSEWLGWYDWRWNHTNAANRGVNGAGVTNPYNADRHPMLGWYPGDQSNVLAWQVKWLVEHGVKFVICQQRAPLPDDNGQWNLSYNVAHWIFQLMTSVTNIGSDGLQLAFWLPYGDHSPMKPSDTLAAYAASKRYWAWNTAYSVDDTVIHGASEKQYRCRAAGNTSLPMAATRPRTGSQSTCQQSGKSLPTSI
ncbi:MAG: hypothetical protein HEQ39_14355 [Rhizobacter sp.]